LVSATTSTKKTAARKPASRTSSSSKKKAGTTKVAASKLSRSGSTKTRSKTPVKPTVARRYYQSTPTPDRYKEIQDALAHRGYYKGEANGAWGPDSVEALKRFQQEQNVPPSGKLDSVSLIALGLGPKRNLVPDPGPNPTPPRPTTDDYRSPEGSQRP
jgi:hypothetical protein